MKYSCPDRLETEQGYVVAILLVLVVLAAVVVAGSLETDSVAHKTNYNQNVRIERYYEAEESLNIAAGWLRENSQKMMSAFLKENIYSKFSRGAVSAGSNDTVYATPTSIKSLGTTNSVFLSSDSSLGTSNFPTTTDSNGNTFNVVSDFAANDFGNALVKITLLDAKPKTASGDTAPTPTTDYIPMFRIDAMSSVNSGVHLYGYVVGKLRLPIVLGFYGRDSVTANQDCDSYNSTAGSYSMATKAANCPIGSAGTICVKNNTDIYGSVSTTGSVATSGQCGGDVCADLSCAAEGETCEGSECGGEGDYPSYPSYDSVCPSGSEQASVTVSSDTTLTTTGSASTQKCWQSVTVNNNRTLTLTSTSNPYYFRSLDLKGSIDVVPDSANGTVTVYVKELADTTINGNQTINSASRPSQFQLIYLGSDDVRLNGNADFKLLFIAPDSDVTVQGNADYYGGIIAKNLDLTGSAELHYDESINNVTPMDIVYKLVNFGEQYR